jgi:putative ABC transport system permease protein
VTVEGRAPEEVESLQIGMIPVVGDYFETIGMRLVAGRSFNEAERSGTAVVAVVNESAARALWPNGDAVGRRFKAGDPEENEPWATVIGVVNDVRRFTLGRAAQPEIYWSHHLQAGWAREMNLVARTAGDPVQLAEPVRSVLRALDPEIAMTRAGRVSDFVAATISEPRFRTVLLSAFAAAALLLALAGIYGVMAFSVTQQVRDIGVRMALGAERGRVLREIMGQAGTLILAGLGIGLGLAAIANRSLVALLFGVEPGDAATYLAVSALLAAAALAACLAPALRASRVQPVIAMKEQAEPSEALRR